MPTAIPRPQVRGSAAPATSSSGVEPGSVEGSPVHDSAKIETWLAPFVGRTPNGPEWISTYVEVNGREVLVLTVEPPEFGHGGWPCRKGWADPKEAGPGLRKGALYVRHKASTEEADDADVEMLNRRAAGAQRRIGGVTLLLGPDSRSAAVDASAGAIAAWVGREREALDPARYSPPSAPNSSTVNVEAFDPNSSLAITAQMVAALGQSANTFASGLFERDTRTPESYQKEVDAYITKAEKRIQAAILWRAFNRGLGRLALFVRNDTDDPIRQLQIEVYIPDEGLVAFDEGDISPAELPARPILLGKRIRSPFADLGAISVAGLGLNRYAPSFPSIGPIGRGVKIDNGGSVRLTFDPLDLYPQETADLPEVTLFANQTLAGTTLAAEWSARSRDASGVMRGGLEIRVDAAVATVDDLLAEAEKLADRDEDDED